VHYLRGKKRWSRFFVTPRPSGSEELDWGCGVADGFAYLWLGDVVFV
jgi:hypothetical protein